MYGVLIMGKNYASREHGVPRLMKAVRIHQFGGLETIMYEEVSRPAPAEGQVLVRVEAAGVGPWDAWVRAGKSANPQPLPLILGSDLSGLVEEVGPDVSGFRTGDDVFGVTNSNFTGAYAECAVGDAAMVARKPVRLSYVEAASVPVVASTAWQMLFDHGQVNNTKRVLIHGAAGSVGAYAVQLAKQSGAEVIATVLTRDVDYLHTLHADQVMTFKGRVLKKKRGMSMSSSTRSAARHSTGLSMCLDQVVSSFLRSPCPIRTRPRNASFEAYSFSSPSPPKA
jgi:NADPH:quinone reductase-like Zn-dependent oxidoreductase